VSQVMSQVAGAWQVKKGGRGKPCQLWVCLNSYQQELCLESCKQVQGPWCVAGHVTSGGCVAGHVTSGGCVAGHVTSGGCVASKETVGVASKQRWVWQANKWLANVATFACHLGESM
jgi:hypothetical protein